MGLDIRTVRRLGERGRGEDEIQGPSANRFSVEVESFGATVKA